MASAPNAEVYVGSRQAEIREKGIGHIGIIVLPRMDDNRFGPFLFL
jgi:hypothetical protein